MRLAAIYSTIFKQPILILFVALVLLFNLVLIVNLNTAGSESEQQTLRLLLRNDMRDFVNEKNRELEKRLRLLEEEAVYKRQPPGIDAYESKHYPPVQVLNESQQKRILVTGGAGFVGSHLVDKLLQDGHEVIVVDNFFTGRRRNLEHWVGHHNFQLINHDVVERIFLEVDQIYHLASPASPVKYMYNSIKTLKTNTIGALNMLGLAKRVKARFLFASTSEVYGDPTEHPQSEEYWGNVNPIGPRSCYDEGKRVGEAMVYAYAKQERLDVRVARIFNTYGPRMHMFDGRVVSNFIIQALKGEPLTVNYPGNQTRSFMYITDLVDGLIKLMESNFTKPVNLGNPDEYTIIEFAKIICNLTGEKFELTFSPEQTDDPHRRRPNIARAKKELGWEPLVSLTEGITKTIDYFRKELAGSEERHKPS